RRTLRRQRIVERERERAAPLVAALLAGQRRLRDLSEGEARLLRGLPMVELLLAQSRTLRHRDPRQMLQYTELALHAIERLAPQRYGPTLITDLHAQAWAELGNARRIMADLPGAWEALLQAQQWAERGSGDPLLLARIADFTASLLADQRRFGEAAKVLERVHSLYRRLHDRHLAGRVLITQGAFAGYAGEPKRALSLTLQGLESIDLEREPGLAQFALHNLIKHLVDAGRYRQARRLLWRLRAGRLLPTDPMAQLRLRWVEGKILTGLGQLEPAERALLQVADGFQQAEQVYMEALTRLDLALVWVAQWRLGEVRTLAAELLETFRGLAIPRETLASVVLLRELCSREWVSQEILRESIGEISVLLTELEHEPIAPTRSPRSRS
nr:hypothetical protein [Acidobacteriota bacterium]